MGWAISDRWMLKFAKDWLDMLHSPGGKDISAAEVDQAALPEDNLLRQVSYQGQREDKPGFLILAECGPLYSIASALRIP